MKKKVGSAARQRDGYKEVLPEMAPLPDAEVYLYREPRQKVVAYLRVSTNEQDVANQKLEILNLVNEKKLGNGIEFIEEVISGRISWKDRVLAKTIEGMKPGDVLVVAELSRLGRSMLEIMEILSLATRASIRIYASKGNWSLDGSLQSKVLAMAFSMAAEIERDLLVQRTRAAMETRRALCRDGKTWISKRGNVVGSLGRPRGPGRSKLDPHREQIIEYLILGLSKTKIAARYGASQATLWNWMKQNKIGLSGQTLTG